MADETFTPGQTYENVYLIVVDASGYSSIVRFNPLDRAAAAFDQLRERAVARVHTVSAKRRCARAAPWSWRGDGGMLAVHDENESVARDVALSAARDILKVDLRGVRETLRRTELNGELRLRVAVHKGTVRYSVGGHTGAIHSPVINLAAHLVAGRHADAFELVGNHESSNIYLMAPSGETPATPGEPGWRTSAWRAACRSSPNPSAPARWRSPDWFSPRVRTSSTWGRRCAPVPTH